MHSNLNGYAKEYVASSQYFSPLPSSSRSHHPSHQSRLLPILFSPDDLSSRLGGLHNEPDPLSSMNHHHHHHHHLSHHHQSYAHPNYPYPGDYENIEIAGNHYHSSRNQVSSHQMGHPNHNNYSYNNYMQPYSPHLSLRANGHHGSHQHTSQYASSRANTNNLFHQSQSHRSHQSSYQHGQNPYIGYEMYHQYPQGAPSSGVDHQQPYPTDQNDLFDDMGLQDWMEGAPSQHPQVGHIDNSVNNNNNTKNNKDNHTATDHTSTTANPADSATITTSTSITPNTLNKIAESKEEKEQKQEEEEEDDDDEEVKVEEEEEEDDDDEDEEEEEVEEEEEEVEEEEEEEEEEDNTEVTIEQVQPPLRKKLKNNLSQEVPSVKQARTIEDREAAISTTIKKHTSKPSHQNSSLPLKEKVFSQPQHQGNNRILSSSEKTLKQGFFISPENQKSFSRNTITPIKNPLLDTISNYTTPNTLQQKNKVKTENENEVEDVNSTNFQNASANRDEKVNPGRNGLRILSKKVREIVCELKETTYKQVAEYLIADMEAKKQNSAEFANEAKDEQNVKRRVYDALNVLIAANVLTKEGKKVKAEQIIPRGNPASQNPLQKREYLHKALMSKRARLERKQDTINDLILKYVSLKYICARNAATERSQRKQLAASQTVQASNVKVISNQKTESLLMDQTGTEFNDPGSKLRFPFIGVYSPLNNSKKFNSGLLVSSVQQLNIQGDIDILVKLYACRSPDLLRNDKHRFLSEQLLSFLCQLSLFINTTTTSEYPPSNQYNSNSLGLYAAEEANSQQFEVTVSNNKHIERKNIPPLLLSHQIATRAKSSDPFYNPNNSDDQIEQEDTKQQPIAPRSTARSNPHQTRASRNPQQSPKKATGKQKNPAAIGVVLHESDNEYQEDSNEIVNDYMD